MSRVKLDKDGWPVKLWIPEESEFCRGHWGRGGRGDSALDSSEIDGCGTYACLVGGTRWSFGCEYLAPNWDYEDPLPASGIEFLIGVCARLGADVRGSYSNGTYVQLRASNVFEEGTGRTPRVPPTFAEVRAAWVAEAKARGYDVTGEQ